MPRGLDYVINLKNGNFSGVDNAKNKVGGLDSAVSKTGKNIMSLGPILSSVGGMIVAAFAVHSIAEFTSESRALWKETKMAIAQVEQGIKTTGGAAGKSLDELKEKAEALEHTSLFSQGQILTADSLLLTFANIKGKIYDQAMPAIADLAQRMAGSGPADLKGASIQVGKALNDPILGLTALRRVGVSFSAQQREQIKTLVEHGDLIKAQGIILNELNTEFGGSAAAARKALGVQGDLNEENERLKRTYGELFGLVKKQFTPALIEIVRTVRTGMEWFKQHKDIIVDVTKAVGVGAAVWGIYELTLLAVKAPMAIVTAAQWALNVAMTANPIGLIIAGIAILAGGFYLAYQRSEKFRAVLSGVMEVGKLLGNVFLGVGKIILGAFMFNPKMFVEGVKQTVKVATEIADGGISKAFNKGFNSSIEDSRKNAALKKKESAMDKLANSGSPTAAGAKAGGKSSDTTVSSNKQVRNVTVTIGKLVENLTVATTNLQGASTGDIKRMITELLVGSVHDSELALSSE